MPRRNLQPLTPPETYAEYLREAMSRLDITRRTLSITIKFSYEHLRKILTGAPLMSDIFNERVCLALGLDDKEMWRLAQLEKATQRGTVPVLPDQSVAMQWNELSIENKARVAGIIQVMCEVQRYNTPKSAEEIRLEIARLTGQLGTKMQEEVNALKRKMSDSNGPQST